MSELLLAEGIPCCPRCGARTNRDNPRAYGMHGCGVPGCPCGNVVFGCFLCPKCEVALPAEIAADGLALALADPGRLAAKARP